MKKYIYIFIIIISITSCTKEVVISGLDNAIPKLVVEANIDINKNDDNASKTQTVKLSTTATSYYSNVYPQVKGAIVNVTDENGNSMGTFLDVNPNIPNDEEDGIYTAVDFTKPTLGEKYFLNITYDGEVFTAEDTYTSIVDINNIQQDTISFFGTEQIQLKINIDNEIGVDNYFLTKYEAPFRIIPEYETNSDDQLSEEPGLNTIDLTYIDEELKKDTQIDITIYGVSEAYQKFLEIILSLSQGSNGPFSTAPAPVRGNILNTTNKENNALGYFSVNQFVKASYTIK